MIDSSYKSVVLTDQNDSVVGYKEKFKAHKNPVPLHRAISVVIFSPDKKRMLIQKRSKYKKTWPLFWSNTVCTNVLPNETYEAAAKRRLREEMGFSTPLKELFKFIYKAKYNKTWGEHELDQVFIGKYQGKVDPDPNEAADYKWIPIGELKKDIGKNPEIYTPWFRIILEKLRFK